MWRSGGGRGERKRAQRRRRTAADGVVDRAEPWSWGTQFRGRKKSYIGDTAGAVKIACQSKQTCPRQSRRRAQKNNGGGGKIGETHCREPPLQKTLERVKPKVLWRAVCRRAGEVLRTRNESGADRPKGAHRPATLGAKFRSAKGGEGFEKKRRY